MIDIIERARRYVAKLDGAVAGSGGHNATFHAACVLVQGFALSEGDALMLMREYNLKCAPSWSERDLGHKVRSAMNARDERPRGWLLDADAGAAESSKHQAPSSKAESGVGKDSAGGLRYDPRALERMQHQGLIVTRSWLEARSQVDVVQVTTEGFLRQLYNPGEKVLCFTNERSQGDFGYAVGAGWRALDPWAPLAVEHKDRMPWAVSSKAAAHGPRTGKLGVWYLCQPVDGLWHWDADNADKGKWTRRSWRSVTDWRHMVLESDSAPSHLYLNWLVQQPLPIAAIYTSAGKSIHALLRWEGVRTKVLWDAIRDRMKPYLTVMGVDWKTLTAVRLTRLPGCLREGKLQAPNTQAPSSGEAGAKPAAVYQRFAAPRMQQLLYFNPRPEAVPILDLEPVRELGGKTAEEVPF